MDPDLFIEEIAQEIVSETCIPFVGAGFSGFAGYPTWKELMKKIIIKHKEISSDPLCLDRADEYLELGKLQDAANFLLSQLGDKDCKSLACEILRSHQNGGPLQR